MGLFDNIHERLNEALRAAHQEELSSLSGGSMDIAKADLDDRDPLKRNKKTYNRAALVDPNLSAYYGGGGFGLYKPRFSHISFKTLKEMSIRDPIVATIVQTRINQIAAFTRPQNSRYDTGFKILPIDPELDIKPNSKEEEEIKFLTNFICNTGIVDEHRDPDDYLNFDTWLKVVIRDRLTYGSAAIETVRDMGGRIHSFLPVPTETIFYANKAISDEMIDHSKIVNKQTYFEHGRDGVPSVDTDRLKRGEYEYVQVIEGRVVEGFTKEQMIYKLGNPQNFIDNNGYCFVPKTARVQLGYGATKFVEDVEVGDTVIDSDGNRNKVLELKNRSYSGEIIQLNVRGLDSLHVTPEHLLLVVDHHQKLEPKWVAAKDIKPGHYICIPKISHTEDAPKEFDLSGFWERRTSNYIEKIALDETLGWFLGVYSGDGCIQKDHGRPKVICFDIGKHEKWIIEKLRSVGALYNATVSERALTDNLVRVHIYSAGLANFVKSVCPGNSHTKKIPEFIFHAPQSVRVSFLTGWLDADGNHNCKSNSGISTLRGVTVSPDLAFGLSELSNTCGFLAKVRMSENFTFNKKCAYFTISWKENFTGSDIVKGMRFAPSSKKRIQDDKYHYVRISSISNYDYDGMVANFEVENSHSYTANTMVSHNCLGELEMATTTITAHMQAENYNKLFFTHGFAARGLLHIKGDVTPSQLQAFRAQWYSQVSGNANSWRTPILAGVDDIQWIQLAASNRDMEYIAYVDHIIRILCSLFQMSPMECGFDYLVKGTGQKSLGEANNEWKLQEAKDRGLRPLLVWAESIINDEIIPGIDPQLAEKYKFAFVGLNAESRDEELKRHEMEMSLHTSIDDIRKELDKDPIVGGKIILNPNYIQFLMRTHTVGEIREKLLGYPDDASNELFDYIADGPYLENRMQVTGIGAPPQGPVGPDGQPIPTDETGQPVGPDGQPLSPEEMQQMGIQPGQPQEQQMGPDGQPLPGGEQGRQPGMGGDMIEQTVLAYLQEHPELVEKSLIKSADTNNLNNFHENLRQEYMKVFQDVQQKMLKEILEEVKEDLDDESESRSADKENSSDN